MRLLKKTQKFYGVSPFYFASMNHSTQYLFRDILEREVPELTRGFIESLIEIEETVLKYYSGARPDHLTEEDCKVIYNDTVAKTMVFIYEKCLRIHLNELKDIIGHRVAGTGTSANLMLAHVSLDNFITMASQHKEEFIKEVLSKFDSSDYSASRDMKIKELNELLSSVNISIEMVSRRVALYEHRPDKGFSPTTVFGQVIREVENIDENLFHEIDFRRSLTEIGLDVSMCAKKFKSMESAIKKLKGTRYSTNRAISLIYCRETLEKLRTLLMSKISEYSSGVSLPRLYW